MTAHRKTAELTADANGYAEEDLVLYPVSSIDRLTRLMGVRVASSGAAPTLTVRHLEQDDEDLEVYHPGDEVLYVAGAEDGFYYPQAAGDDASQTPLTTGVITAFLHGHIRVEMDSVALDECTVEVFYDTAGDQRF